MDFRPKDSSVLFLFLSDRRIVNGCQLSSVQEEGCWTHPQHLEHYTLLIIVEHYTLLNIVEYCTLLNIVEHCWTLNTVEHCTCWTLHTLNIVQHCWTLHMSNTPQAPWITRCPNVPMHTKSKTDTSSEVKKIFGVIIQQKQCSFFFSFPFLLWVHINNTDISKLNLQNMTAQNQIFQPWQRNKSYLNINDIFHHWSL